MHRGIRLTIFIFVTCPVWGQIAADSTPHDGPLVWHPPQVEFPDALPRPTVPKEMITTLRVAKVPVVLEKTELKDVQRRLPGGIIGQSGDASEAVAWLCFYGSDENGRWAFWLDSSEIGGLRWIDGFTLQRIGNNTRMDRRCRMIREDEGGIELPIALRLGQTEMQVRKILGRPTVKYRSTLIFDHQHEETVHNEHVTVSNLVAVSFRGGVVWSILVSRQSED